MLNRASVSRCQRPPHSFHSRGLSSPRAESLTLGCDDWASPSSVRQRDPGGWEGARSQAGQPGAGSERRPRPRAPRAPPDSGSGSPRPAATTRGPARAGPCRDARAGSGRGGRCGAGGTHREEDEEQWKGAAGLGRGPHAGGAAAAVPSAAGTARPARRQGCGRSGFLEEGPPPGQGRAGQGPAPPPQVRRGWARRRRASAVLCSSLEAPRSSVQQAPGSVAPGRDPRAGPRPPAPAAAPQQPPPYRLGAALPGQSRAGTAPAVGRGALGRGGGTGAHHLGLPGPG